MSRRIQSLLDNLTRLSLEEECLIVDKNVDEYKIIKNFSIKVVRNMNYPFDTRNMIMLLRYKYMGKQLPKHYKINKTGYELIDKGLLYLLEDKIDYYLNYLCGQYRDEKIRERYESTVYSNLKKYLIQSIPKDKIKNVMLCKN